MRYILAVVIIVWLITFALRAAPFIFLNKLSESKTLAYLAKAMPAAVMLILVVFTLQDITFTNMQSWVPAILGVAATIGLQLAFRKVLISLLGGTAIFAVALSLF